MERFCAACGPLLIRSTLKVQVPGDVGVPEISPVLSFRDRPAGREPSTIDQT